MMTAGIDCGAKNTKTVVLKDDQVIGRGKISTGFDPAASAEASLEQALKQAGMRREDLEMIAGTGSGKACIKAAGIEVDDILAMCKGAHSVFPNARTVVDVGAEEGRAARMDKTGNPEDFAVNEKCAAGAGTFIETMSRALDIPLEELGTLALTSDNEIPMNAQCAVFAESEVVGLIHARTAKKDISKAVHDAMANRIVTMIRQVGANEDVVMIGGVAYNPAIVTVLKQELGLETIYIPESPEFTAALGAACAAAEEVGPGAQ
ncbi:MAG: acyl-CoA dehydratase activase [Desulfobacteraceae bacterium]|jgi:benzoyl-CoA reductase subunit D